MEVDFIRYHLDEIEIMLQKTREALVRTHAPSGNQISETGRENETLMCMSYIIGEAAIIHTHIEAKRQERQMPELLDNERK